MHTNSLDETFALPTEEAATVALRTQQLIADETGVAKVVDPLGGSWFVEDLTNRMEQAGLDLIERIDRMGGIVEAVEAGFPQREIAQSVYDFQRRVERQEEIIVGINRYGQTQHAPIPTLKIEPEVERQQVEGVRALEQVRSACRSGANLMPVLLDAGRADCTLGEICQVYREVFGEYRDPGGY